MLEVAQETLPTAEERALYLSVLEQGGRVLFREALEESARAVLRLMELGLLFHQTHDDSLVAVNPRLVSERISDDLRSRATQLLVYAQSTPSLMGEMAHAYDAMPPRGDRSCQIQHVDKKETIQHRIVALQTSCHEEVLAAQPGKRPIELLADDERARSILAHGGLIKVLYEPRSKSDPATVDYAVRASEWGMKFRVLGGPFTRMLIFDGKVAVVPAAPDNSSVAFVEDSAVVGFLVGTFERDWARAERVQWSALRERSTSAPVHEQIGRLLAQGLTQRVIASAL